MWKRGRLNARNLWLATWASVEMMGLWQKPSRTRKGPGVEQLHWIRAPKGRLQRGKAFPKLSGLVTWPGNQLRQAPLCSCGLRKLHVSSVLASFSHSQSCVVGNKLCEIKLQKRHFGRIKRLLNVSIFCLPVSSTFPCVQKSVISLFTDCSWTSSPLYY